MNEVNVSAPVDRVIADLSRVMRREVERKGRRFKRAVFATVGAVVAVTATAGATGTLPILRSTSNYQIGERATEAGGDLCLELTSPGRRPVYGCGQSPTSEQPFGVFVVAVQAGSVRVVYGVVADDITSVRIEGIDVPTREGNGFDGRFFSIEVPDRGPVYAEALDGSGSIRGHVGARTASKTPARNRDEARAHGDPAGFAPVVSGGLQFVYRGKAIAPERAADLGLTCTEDETARAQCVEPDSTVRRRP